MLAISAADASASAMLRLRPLDVRRPADAHTHVRDRPSGQHNHHIGALHVKSLLVADTLARGAHHRCNLYLHTLGGYNICMCGKPVAVGFPEQGVCLPARPAAEWIRGGVAAEGFSSRGVL